MPTPPEAYLRIMLARTKQELAEAEQRREHQARIVDGILDSPGARAAAGLLLREIDRTIAAIRTNRDLIEDILA
jgi:hypothetical protein